MYIKSLGVKSKDDMMTGELEVSKMAQIGWRNLCTAPYYEETNMILQNQNKMEEKLNENFNYFNQKLSDILSKLNPSHENPSSQRPPQSDSDQPTPVLHTLSQPSVVSRQASIQCNICGKSFGSSRALENHTRKDHVPKS